MQLVLQSVHRREAMDWVMLHTTKSHVTYSSSSHPQIHSQALSSLDVQLLWRWYHGAVVDDCL